MGKVRAYRVAAYIPHDVMSYKESYYHSMDEAKAKCQEFRDTLPDTYIVRIQTIED